MPPNTVFYAKTGGKSAPWYRTLAGIKSALKMCQESDLPWPPRVFQGTISWQEIDVETGRYLYRTPDVAIAQHCRIFHPDLILGHDPIETHNLPATHANVDHVHGKFS